MRLAFSHSPKSSALLGIAAFGMLGVLLAAPRTAEGTAPPAPGAGSRIPNVKPSTPNDLEFRPGALTVVTDEEDGQRYWVFTYTISNRTGKTQRFSPRFELLMGDGAVLPAGRGVPVEAAARLQRRVASPQAVDQFQIMGDILDGEANARDGFVIWPSRGDAKEITLFISGMSYAFDRAQNPATGKDEIVRRTWTRKYVLPGTADPKRATPATFDSVNDAWVMR